MTLNIKALVVDDDILFASMIETYLMELGILSKIIHNGADALQILANEHFDLMITDFQMPEMNGFTLLKEITSNGDYNRLKTILVTGGGGNAEELNNATQLADQYIFKPFSLELLEEKIKGLNLNALS